ncbi:hypothetical protein J4225_03665 [Candidatus Pacearchaeota archaeon]|nr:hypothetical protein [Candidatus Pacearchaeota archaeon]
MEKNKTWCGLINRVTGYAAIGLACSINAALVLSAINLNDKNYQAQNRIDTKSSLREIVRKEFSERLMSEIKQRVYGVQDAQEEYNFENIDMQKKFMEIYNQKLLERAVLN